MVVAAVLVANSEDSRKPVPPLTLDETIEKVRMAGNGWISRDPERIALAYSPTASGEIGNWSAGRTVT